LTPAKRSSGGSSKQSGKGGSTKEQTSTAARKRSGPAARAQSGSRQAKSSGEGAAGSSSVEDRLDELQPWQRGHSRGPQATGLGRMEQWVSAYAEGTLKPGEGDSPGPTGVIAD
jgi:hypothetical protein